MAGLTPGLNPNIRLVENSLEAQPQLEGMDVLVIEEAPEGAGPEMDMEGNVLRIEHDDGSISISLDGQPIERAKKKKRQGWFKNLAEDMSDNDLGSIAEDLMRGINQDLESRKEWIEDRAQGIRLLGLKIEIPGVQGAADGAPVEGMSKVRAPILLEAVLRFQANSRSELLPTDGPVKIRIDGFGQRSASQDNLAEALERDMNHFLTVTASEYYPDTDKMLFQLGFGGSAFKKVYFCPLRNRPVSESIDADDLIVNNQATDLANAKRITHRIFMRPSVVKRMQIIGAYRNVELGDPSPQQPDAVQIEKAQQQGIQLDQGFAVDRDREIYECYCELDIPGFEHEINGEKTGLEVPYRVTIDVSTKKILSIVRNYAETDQDLPTAKKVFVKYTFVPGLGFYDIGLLHILGNTTNAVTAAWRELLDAGMYSNFPGFLYAKQGARQNSNIFRVPPGGGAQIDTGGLSIQQTVMPLPYKEPSGALMNMANYISEYGQRIGGTAEMAVGEGKQESPVGTTLAMIEQATKVLSAVHKRLHASQAEEFQLLAECFREHPNSFWKGNKRPAYPWDETIFVAALADYDLVPQADPNTASHVQRVMKVMALIQLASQAPQLYNLPEVNKKALKTIGWDQVDELLAPPRPPMPDPKTQADLLDAQSKMAMAQAKVAETAIKSKDADIDGANRQADRESREKIAYANLVKEVVTDPAAAPLVEQMVTPEFVRSLMQPG
jgi:hypothetical protein